MTDQNWIKVFQILTIYGGILVITALFIVVLIYFIRWTRWTND